MSDIPLLSMFIPGTAIAQGSKINYGVGKLVDQNHKKLKPWRAKVAQYFKDNWSDALKNCNAYSFGYVFYFHAPKARAKKVNRWIEEHDGERTFPRTVKIDLDKGIRAINDGFTDGTGIDDSKIYRMDACKYEIPMDEPEGVQIYVWGETI